MDSIEVTFPAEISPVDVQYNIMVGMKTNANVLCDVVAIGHNNEGEIRYRITADRPEHFYLIGMTASAIISHHNDKLKADPSAFL